MKSTPKKHWILLITMLSIVCNLFVGCTGLTMRDQSYLDDLDVLLGDDANPFLPKRIKRMRKKQMCANTELYDTNFILLRRRSPKVPKEVMNALENYKWTLIELNKENFLLAEKLKHLFQENALRKGQGDQDLVDLPQTVKDDKEFEKKLHEEVALFDRNYHLFFAGYRNFKKALAASGAGDYGKVVRYLTF